MGRSCLLMVQTFCGRRGLVQPNTAVSSSDTQVIQILGLLNQGGAAIARRHEWQSLTDEATFTTVAAADQGALTTIIGANNSFRRVIDETIWNRTTQRIVAGPLYAAERQGRLAIVTAGPFSEYSIRGGHLLFDPIPTAGESCYFEYVSNNWCTDSTAVTRRSFFTQDEDLSLFDDELHLADLQWRWNKSKGLEYAEDFNEFEAMLIDRMTEDKTARRKNLDQLQAGLRTGIFVPSGNFNLTQMG